MRKEIDKAVETFHNIAFGTSKGTQVISEKQLTSFVTVLTELLIVRYQNNWYPDKPIKGSGYRCLRMNTQCIDPTIVKSLMKSEIPVDEIRTKELTIWVDPGVVSIRIGEEGSIGTEDVEMEDFVPPPLRLHSYSSEDEAYSSDGSSPPPLPSFIVSVPLMNSHNRVPSIAQRGTIPRLSTNPMPHRIVSNAQELTAGQNIPATMAPYSHITRARTLFPDMIDSRPVAMHSPFKAYDMAMYQSRQAAAAMSAHQMHRMVPRSNYLDIPVQA